MLGTLFISFLVTFQSYIVNPKCSRVNPFWITQATIDASRLIGFPTYRNKVPLEILNHEFYLRERMAEDRAPSRRRQFIQDYINNVNNPSTR